VDEAIVGFNPCVADFRQLRLVFRRNSFGDRPGIVPEP
jgi:hypothetical protein